MSDHYEAKRFCAIIQLGRSSDIKRVAESVPALTATIKRWSKGEMEQVCRSNDGQLFGYLFNSSKPVGMMMAEFQTSFASNNSDSFIVFEVGADFAGAGFSRAWTWLQRH